jgi:N-succinyldiaminopimelate aminotransferase
VHVLGAEYASSFSMQFCHRLTREAGVTLIPVSAFYEDRSVAPKSLVRFVFCKTDEKLAVACEKLEAYINSKSGH